MWSGGRTRRTGEPSSSSPPSAGSTRCGIEARHAKATGGKNYAEFRDVLRGVVARSREPADNA
jgi:hypothetical protein